MAPSPEPEAPAEPAAADPEQTGGFRLALDNFDGPFDLLLTLIGNRSMDVTEIALSRVTNDFIAYVRTLDTHEELEQASEFIVVAATLLDLKIASLLPAGDVVDSEDVALLEARDLLFARLLQYRAFKVVAEWVEQRWDAEGRFFGRPGGLEPQFVALLPEVQIGADPEQLARIAAGALTPEEAAEVSLSHLHAPAVSVAEQAEILVQRLRTGGRLSFTELTADSPNKLTTVCRFLALLELFREKAITFEQDVALGRLQVRWTGDVEQVEITEEFDGQPEDDVPRQNQQAEPEQET